MARPSLTIGTYGTLSTKQVRGDDGKVKHWLSHARFRDLDGVTRLVRRIGATKGKAEAELKSALRERVTPTDGPINQDSRYEEVAGLWLATVKKHNAPTTYDTYRRVLDETVLPRFGQLRLREITPAHISWALEVLDGRYTANGLRQVRKVLSGPLSYARDQRVIADNPALRLAPIKGRAKKSRALTRDEERALLRRLDVDRKCRDNDLPDLTRFLLGTGCRISEALGLRWVDVDLDKGQVRITGALVRVKGQGLQREVGKTNAANRLLYLPENVTLLLRMRWDDREMHDKSPVFASAAGTWRDLNNIQRLYRHARAGVRGEDDQPAPLSWLTTHTFRRTVATRLDEAGMSARAIADQLGHSDPSMSQDVYMARTGENTASTAAVLNAA